MSRDPIPTTMRKAALNRTQGECVCCGWNHPNDIELHHIIPWKTVQEHTTWNLIPVCRECHDLIQPQKVVLYDYINRDSRYKSKIIEIFTDESKSNNDKINLLRKKSKIRSYKLNKSVIGRTCNYLSFLENKTQFNVTLSCYKKGTGDLELRWTTEIENIRYLND